MYPIICKDPVYIYVDKNEITIKVTDEAVVSQSYLFNLLAIGM